MYEIIKYIVKISCASPGKCKFFQLLSTKRILQLIIRINPFSGPNIIDIETNKKYFTHTIKGR